MKFELIDENNVVELFNLLNNTIYHQNLGENIRNQEEFVTNTLALTKGMRRNHSLIRDENNAPLGTVFGYSYYPNDRNMCMSLYVSPDAYGLGIRAAKKFLIEIFKKFNLHKIYFHVYSYNDKCLQIIKRLKIKQEGLYEEHRIVDGKFYDLYVFSISAKQFNDLLQKY